MKQAAAVGLAVLVGVSLVGCASEGARSEQAALTEQGAVSQAAPPHFSDGLLVDKSGRTLYTYDNDSTGYSSCYGACAGNWPPLLAPTSIQGEHGFSTVTRNNGAEQWAYQGKPLYLFSKDQKPGDQKGNDVKDVWHTVTPLSGSSSTSSSLGTPGY